MHFYLSNKAEASLRALLTKQRDTSNMYLRIHENITDLVTPPTRFLLSEELRRSGLFQEKVFP